MELRSWSPARAVAKTPNVVAKGTRPSRAIPAATESMFCSCTPQLKKRSGKTFSKSQVFVATETSLSRTTIRGSSRPSSMRASA